MPASPRQASALAKGTPTRQARAAMKRALAAGEVEPHDVIAGQSLHEEAVQGMPLLKLLDACGLDAVQAVQALESCDALDLRSYDLRTIPPERRHAIADAVRNLEPA